MKSIILIGMMGSGKSTVGKKIADIMGTNYVDTDNLIEQKHQMTINSIFENYGEDHFRRLEEDVISSLNHKYQVISTGGGVILSNNNIMHLKQLGIIVYLKVSKENLINRLINKDNHRPLLKDGLEIKISEIYKERKETYESVANYTIDSNCLSVDETVQKIINILK